MPQFKAEKLHRMNKLAFVFVVLGSGLAAFGLSCWHLATSSLWVAGDSEPTWNVSAGWTATNQLEITIGVMLLVCGLLLRRDSR